MPVSEELRALDKVNVSVILKRRDSLTELLLSSSDLVKLIGESADILVPALLSPYATKLGVSAEVLEQSLFALLGNKSNGYPTLNDCKKTNWILAANLDTLKIGKPVEPFSKLRRREWVPVSISGGIKDVGYFNETGYTYSFIALAGTPASEEFTRFVAGGIDGSNFMHLRALGLPSRKRGFYIKSKHESRRPIEVPGVYVRMRTWVLFDPACEHGKLFDRAECTPSFSEFNRALLRERFEEDCPLNYDWECTDCFRGYDTCARGTHRTTYVVRYCVNCNAQRSFNEGETEVTCLDCRAKDKLERKQFAIKKRMGEHANEHAAKR